MVKHFPVGTTFGRLTVVGEPESRKSAQQSLVYFYPCQCSCGKTKLVIRSALTAGLTKSCGCLARDNRTKHNGCTTRLYNIWKAMRQRCELPTRTSYAYYGGKGVTVCPAWQAFESFKLWADNTGYNDLLTIDRIDSSGAYEPKNCRWISQEENTRRAHTKHGSIKCVDTGEIFENCRCVVVLKTDAGSTIANESSVLKAVKQNRLLYGRRYEFVQ